MLCCGSANTVCSDGYSIPSVSYTCDSSREIPSSGSSWSDSPSLEIDIDIPKPECETITDELYISPIMVFYICWVGIGFSSYHIEILKHLNKSCTCIGLYSIRCECSIWCCSDIGLFDARYSCPYSIRDVLRVCVEVLHSSCSFKPCFTRETITNYSIVIRYCSCSRSCESYRPHWLLWDNWACEVSTKVSARRIDEVISCLSECWIHYV